MKKIRNCFLAVVAVVALMLTVANVSAGVATKRSEYSYQGASRYCAIAGFDGSMYHPGTSGWDINNGGTAQWTGETSYNSYVQVRGKLTTPNSYQNPVNKFVYYNGPNY